MTVSQIPAHLVISLPPSDRLATQNSPPVAVSPDGTHIAYAAIHDGIQQLFLRALDNEEAKPIPGTKSAESLSFSPDSQWIGFFAGGKMKKVSISGGAPQTICDSPSTAGATWGSDERAERPSCAEAPCIYA